MLHDVTSATVASVGLWNMESKGKDAGLHLSTVELYYLAFFELAENYISMKAVVPIVSGT